MSSRTNFVYIFFEPLYFSPLRSRSLLRTTRYEHYVYARSLGGSCYDSKLCYESKSLGLCLIIRFAKNIWKKTEIIKKLGIAHLSQHEINLSQKLTQYFLIYPENVLIRISPCYRSRASRVTETDNRDPRKTPYMERDGQTTRASPRIITQKPLECR